MVVEDTDAEEWTAYTEEGLSPEVDTKSSRDTGLVFRSFCGLSAKINDALYLLYEPGGGLSIQKILDLHTQYLQWYDSLPEMLQLGQDYSPSALFVQYVLSYIHWIPLLIQQQHVLSLRYPPSLSAVSSILIRAIPGISQ